MTNRRNLTGTVACLLGLCGIGLMLSRSNPVRAQSSARQAPIFEVDPFWPKPLPNHWVTGSTIGLSVDQQDRVWTIHRPNTVEDNFKAADIKVPFQGHYADSDDYITPQKVDAFEAGLKAAKRTYKLFRYGADHGFMNEQRDVHERVAAELGWKRMLAFWKKYL